MADALFRENLTARGILPEDLQTRMEAFEELLDFLTTCSIKELNNEALSDEGITSFSIWGYPGISHKLHGRRWHELV